MIKQQIEYVKHRISKKQRDTTIWRNWHSLKYGTLPDLEKKLRSRKENEGRMRARNARLLKEEVGEEEIAEVVSGWTGIPVSKLVESEREKLLKLPDILHKRVIGQDEGRTALWHEAVLRAQSRVER